MEALISLQSAGQRSIGEPTAPRPIGVEQGAVLVVLDVNKGASPAALYWALAHVVRKGDAVKVLGIITHIASASKSSLPKSLQFISSHQIIKFADREIVCSGVHGPSRAVLAHQPQRHGAPVRDRHQEGGHLENRPRQRVVPESRGEAVCRCESRQQPPSDRRRRSQGHGRLPCHPRQEHEEGWEVLCGQLGVLCDAVPERGRGGGGARVRDADAEREQAAADGARGREGAGVRGLERVAPRGVVHVVHLVRARRGVQRRLQRAGRRPRVRAQHGRAHHGARAQPAAQAHRPQMAERRGRPSPHSQRYWVRIPAGAAHGHGQWEGWAVECGAAGVVQWRAAAARPAGEGEHGCAVASDALGGGAARGAAAADAVWVCRVHAQLPGCCCGRSEAQLQRHGGL